MSGYLDRPPIRQITLAVRHAMESLDGTPKAVAAQAIQLLRQDNWKPTAEDEDTVLRMVEARLAEQQ